MRTIARALLLTACLVPSFASAQTPPPTEFNFIDPIAVTGTNQMPVGEVLVVERAPGRHSLVRVRTEFVTEMLKSAENL